MDRLQPWKIVESRSVFRAGPWFEVFRQQLALPDGRVVDDYYRIDAGDYVEILAMDSSHHLLGMWRYKHGAGRVNLGLPAGYLQAGETPLAAGRRELAEECGLASDDWETLGAFAVDGNRGCGNAHFLLARCCGPARERPPSDDLEECRQVWLSLDDWSRLLRQGRVGTLGAAAAVLWALCLTLPDVGLPNAGAAQQEER